MPPSCSLHLKSHLSPCAERHPGYGEFDKHDPTLPGGFCLSALCCMPTSTLTLVSEEEAQRQLRIVRVLCSPDGRETCNHVASVTRRSEKGVLYVCACECVHVCIHAFMHACGGQKTSSGVRPPLPAYLRQGLLLLFTALCSRLAGLQASEDSLVSASHSQSGSTGVTDAH